MDDMRDLSNRVQWELGKGCCPCSQGQGQPQGLRGEESPGQSWAALRNCLQFHLALWCQQAQCSQASRKVDMRGLPEPHPHSPVWPVELPGDLRIVDRTIVGEYEKHTVMSSNGSWCGNVDDLANTARETTASPEETVYGSEEVGQWWQWTRAVPTSTVHPHHYSHCQIREAPPGEGDRGNRAWLWLHSLPPHRRGSARWKLSSAIDVKGCVVSTSEFVAWDKYPPHALVPCYPHRAVQGYTPSCEQEAWDWRWCGVGRILIYTSLNWFSCYNGHA